MGDVRAAGPGSTIRRAIALPANSRAGNASQLQQQSSLTTSRTAQPQQLPGVIARAPQATLRRKPSDSRRAADSVEASEEAIGEGSGLLRGLDSSTSTDEQSQLHSDVLPHESADDLKALQEHLLSKGGRHTNHEEVIHLPITSEGEKLHETCFGKVSAEKADKKPKLPVDLSHLSAVDALHEAKRLSMGISVKVLNNDVNWKQAFLYSQKEQYPSWKKVFLTQNSSEVLAFKEKVTNSFTEIIKRMGTLGLHDNLQRQEQLSEAEVKQMVTMLVYLHTVKINERPDTKRPASKPEEVLLHYLRGQCEIVELKQGTIYERFLDLQGKEYPFVFPKDSVSDEEHSITTTDKANMTTRVTAAVPEHAHAIYGIVAPTFYVSDDGSAQVGVRTGGAKAAALTPKTERKFKEAPALQKVSSVDRPTTVEKMAMRKESEIDTKIKEGGKAFLEKWTQFQAEIDKLGEQKHVYTSLTKSINDYAKRHGTKQITEEALCHLIDKSEDKFAKILKVPRLTPQDKIAILVNYQAILMAQQVSIVKPLIASGLCIAGDVLHLVPVIGYGSLAFAGVSMLMEYAEQRQQPITITEHVVASPEPLRRHSGIHNLVEAIPEPTNKKSWIDRLKSLKPAKGAAWVRELKAVGVQRVMLEGLKFVPVVGVGATALSLAAEVLLIGHKIHTYQNAKADANVAKSMKYFNGVRLGIQFAPGLVTDSETDTDMDATATANVDLQQVHEPHLDRPHPHVPVAKADTSTQVGESDFSARPFSVNPLKTDIGGSGVRVSYV